MRLYSAHNPLLVAPEEQVASHLPMDATDDASRATRYSFQWEEIHSDHIKAAFFIATHLILKPQGRFILFRHCMSLNTACRQNINRDDGDQ